MADTSFHGTQGKVLISGQVIGVVNNFEATRRRSLEDVTEVGTVKPVDIKAGLQEVTWRFEKAFITTSGFDLGKTTASGFLNKFDIVCSGIAEASGNNKTLTVSGCYAEEYTFRLAKDAIIVENVTGRALDATLA